jgi:hypothetical protein
MSYPTGTCLKCPTLVCPPVAPDMTASDNRHTTAAAIYAVPQQLSHTQPAKPVHIWSEAYPHHVAAHADGRAGDEGVCMTTLCYDTPPARCNTSLHAK